MAVRIDGPEAVRSSRAATSLPIIAIYTDAAADRSVAITPTFEHALQLAEAGADVIAIDATVRARADDGQDLRELILRIRESTGLPVMADVATFADGKAADSAGADLIGSSTVGYKDIGATKFPDLELVRDLVAAGFAAPIVAERGYATADDVQAAFRLGAHAVVIGSAITDPVYLTNRFSTVR